MVWPGEANAKISRFTMRRREDGGCNYKTCISFTAPWANAGMPNEPDSAIQEWDVKYGYGEARCRGHYGEDIPQLDIDVVCGKDER